jgi:hypothetical protein
LRQFFTEMAADEQGHYRLAEADLAAFGLDASGPVPRAVGDFAAYWNANTPERYFEFLGATYVLENLAGYLRDQTVAALEAIGLALPQARFILTHLEADEDHGRRVAVFCKHYLPKQGEAILDGARAAARFWAGGVREVIGAHLPSMGETAPRIEVA